MNYPPNSSNKNNEPIETRCPINLGGAETIKKLAESVDDLTSAAARMSSNDSCPGFVAERAWLRAERVGRVLDNLLQNWEEGACNSLCVDCRWQEIERGLAIINTLTPCNQWYTPELWENLSRLKAQEASDDIPTE